MDTFIELSTKFVTYINTLYSNMKRKNPKMTLFGIFLILFWTFKKLKKMSKRPISVKNRVVLITGGVSGIGRLTALILKIKGAIVIVWDINDTGIREMEELVDSSMKVDITSTIQVESAAKTIFDKFGHIDILINNAGIGQYAVCWQIDFKHINDIIQTNLISPICLTQLVLRNKLLDKTNHFAHIVNISSGSSMFHPATMSSYSATKSGLSSFSRSIREEFRIANQQNDNLFDFHVSDFIVGSVKDTEVMIKAKSVHGITYNKQLDHVDNSGMTPQRCAELILIGISNQRHEVWTAKQPELIVFYLMHYFKGFTSGVLHYLTADKLFETYPHQMSKL
eukprot:312317_1